MDKKEIDLKSVYESLANLKKFCSANDSCYETNEHKCVLYDERTDGCILMKQLPCEWDIEDKLSTIPSVKLPPNPVLVFESTTKIYYPSIEES